MLNFLLSPLTRLFKALLGAFGWYQAGKERERRKAAEKAAQRADEGRKGAAKAKQDLAEGKTPEQIVRENDGRWH